MRSFTYAAYPFREINNALRLEAEELDCVTLGESLNLFCHRKNCETFYENFYYEKTENNSSHFKEGE